MSAKPGHQFDAELKPHAAGASRRAMVRFDTRGLLVTADDREGERVWPYASLTAASGPITGTSPRAELGSTVEPAARLTVTSPLFAASLAQAAPQLAGRTSRGPDWMPMALTTVAVFGALGLLVWAVAFFLPYKTIARTLPDKTRQSIGEITISSLTKDRKECKAAAGRGALDKLVTRLGKGEKGLSFKVTAVDWELVNAFAVMGNQIVITRGLLQSAGSADEVAGVIGHEMGHSIELHPEASVMRAIGTVAVIQVLVGGWSPDLFTQAGTQLLLMRNSRAAETEADEVAIRLLRDARVSTKGFAGFFEKMAEKQKKSEDKGLSVPEIFASHPPLPDRAKRAAAVPAYPATPALTEEEWQALRDICK